MNDREARPDRTTAVEPSGDEIVELVADGMVAELEMRSAVAAEDLEAMAAWIRRGPEIRARMRALHAALAASRVEGATAEMARSVLSGLAGTFSTLVARHSGAVLRSDV